MRIEKKSVRVFGVKGHPGQARYQITSLSLGQTCVSYARMFLSLNFFFFFLMVGTIH